MMNAPDISRFAGDYSETGRWRDARGNSGALRGRVTIRVEDDRFSMVSDDGHTMVARLPADLAQPILFEGTGGGATTSGSLCYGDESLILEYAADVRGREEHNVDVWTFGGSMARRAGVIRQIARTIWFEAHMERSAS